MNPQCQICGEYLSAAETLSLDVGGGERCRGCAFVAATEAAPSVPRTRVQLVAQRSKEMTDMMADIHRAVAALGEDDILSLLRQEVERLKHLPAAPRWWQWVSELAGVVKPVPWWQWVVELASVLQPSDTVERMKRLEVD